MAHGEFVVKPDLGLELSRSGIGQSVSLNFYDVPFRAIEFLGPGSYSSMLEQCHLGKEYAVSFDFNDDVFAFIISHVPVHLRDSFGASIVGKSFPFSANLPHPVTASTVECHLGNLQHGAHDAIIPLVISGIS